MADLVKDAYRFSWLRCHFMPIVVWLLAIAGVAWLYREQHQSLRVSGVARARIQHIAPVYDARISSCRCDCFNR